MNNIYNFAFVQTEDVDTLEGTVFLVNRSRHHHVRYQRIIQTAPQRGWTALIIDSNAPDHYLLRNLSGRLNTISFEFGIDGIQLYYRLHHNGRTISAFESHLELWIAQKLRSLLNSGNVMQLDLGEPAGRLVLRRYHKYQRSRSSPEAPENMEIPTNIQETYGGRAEDLQPLLQPNINLSYIQDILSPGFSTQAALERLARSLDLPYLLGEQISIDISDDNTQKKEVLRAKDYDILKANTWPPDRSLPAGWKTLLNNGWNKEPNRT